MVEPPMNIISRVIIRGPENNSILETGPNFGSELDITEYPASHTGL
jgi:hypothetical protein